MEEQIFVGHNCRGILIGMTLLLFFFFYVIGFN